MGAPWPLWSKLTRTLSERGRIMETLERYERRLTALLIPSLVKARPPDAMKIGTSNYLGK